MGAWGYGLLESDNAYDCIGEMKNLISMSFNDIMDSLSDLKDNNRKKLKDNLNNEKVFNSLMKNQFCDQYIIFGIYSSLGLFELIENKRNEKIKNGFNDPVIVLRDLKYGLLEKDIWRSKENKEEYAFNIGIVFGNYSNKIEYAINSKGLFETMSKI